MYKSTKFGLFSLLAVFLLTSFKPYTPNMGDTKNLSNDDKTLSPYFFVKSEDDTDRLPLKSTSAEINVAGVIADVRVTQTYKNEGKNPLEAIYIFPASTKATVYAMKMTIGKRVIEAKIKERKQARKDYEQAKQDGKSASLLEQQRPNVFQMNVANILPGDVIKVEMKYTELIIPTDGVYEVVYPTVVGPRYSNVKEGEVSKSEHWVKNPYLHSGEKPTYEFDINANISAGLPISEVTCTSHKTDITYDGKNDAIIKLGPKDKSGGNRDFIVRYRLAGKGIESGLLLYKGKNENFFLTMIQPPKRVKLKDIPRREYIFIVDISGSMRGFPLNTSKTLLRDLIGKLRSTDVFNVLLFAGSSKVMSDKSLPANSNNIRKAIDLIDNQRGGGGTQILAALKKALALPKTEGTSRTVVMVTDGYVRVEEETFDLIRKSLGSANMFSFGIGSSVNRFIIEGMARVGMGEPFIVTKPDEGPALAEKFRKIIESPVLTSIKMDYGKFKVYDVEPLSIPDVMAKRPVIVFGKWKGKPKGAITLKGITGKKEFVSTIDVSKILPKKSNLALKYLWARHKISTLSDYNNLKKTDERVKEVTNLGLTYNLLTAYTSFVAIDSKIRLKDGKAVAVKQPLPLPQGVSDYAVGIGVHGGLGPRPAKMMRFQAESLHVDSTQDKGRVHKRDRSHNQGWDIKFKLTSIHVKGALKKAVVEKKLKTSLEEIIWCYEKSGNKSSYDQNADLKFAFTIDRKGNIKNLRSTKRSNLKINGLWNCIFRTISRLKYSEHPKDNETDVTVKLHFTSKRIS